jgi:hypothetical protein
MNTHAELVAIAHADAEGRNDMETTLATLEPAPVYELQPAGRGMRGMQAARCYYEHSFANFRPLVRGYELIGILTFGENALSGERVYASERLLQVMFGPAYELSEPLAQR